MEFASMRNVLIKNDEMALVHYESGENTYSSYYGVVYRRNEPCFDPANGKYAFGNYIYYNSQDKDEADKALSSAIELWIRENDRLSIKERRMIELAIGFCDALIANTTYEETFDYAKNDLHMTDDELQIFGLEVVG